MTHPTKSVAPRTVRWHRGSDRNVRPWSGSGEPGLNGLGGVVQQRVELQVHLSQLGSDAQMRRFLPAALCAMLTRACWRTFAPDESACRLKATHAVVSWSSWNFGFGCRLAGDRCTASSRSYCAIH